MSQDSTPYASSTSSRRDTEITSVVDFIKAIEEDVKDDPFAIDEATEVFYRGHADESWDLKPSIVRSDKGIKNEHLLFRDMVAHVPQDFSECKSALDYLVQMQHYGLPTRLLDVTTNPLVALYFACQPAGDTTVSGIVNAAFDAAYGIALDAEAYAENYSDGSSISSNSDRLEEILSSVGVLAGVLTAANTKHEENPIGDRMVSCIVAPLIKEFPDFAAEIRAGVDAGKKAAIDSGPKDGAVYLFSVPENRVKHYDSDTVSILSNLAKCGDIEINIHQDEELATKLEQEEDVHMEHEDPSLLAFNNKDGIQILLHQIREEKPYFQPLINPFDLCCTFLVKAKYGNPRIVNQAGAFFLFGLKLTNGVFAVCLEKGKEEEVPRVPAQWVKRKLIIPKEFKAGILKELELLGITDSYIYSGMEQYAKELKKKYKL
jgi:FRG domain protein